MEVLNWGWLKIRRDAEKDMMIVMVILFWVSTLAVSAGTPHFGERLSFSFGLGPAEIGVTFGLNNDILPG